MSKPRHDVFEIILMVIVVVILARPLLSSATNLNKYGKILAALPRGERLLDPPAAKLDNDPSALFDQLDRDTPAKSLPKWHNLMDMIKIDNAQQLTKVKAKEKEGDSPDNWQGNTDHEEELLPLPLPLSAANNYARQQEQRQRHFEHVQNEAADREFDQIMRKLKLKMQLEREDGASMKGVAKKDQFKINSSYCKKPKTKKKCSKTKPTTSTVTTSRVFPSTTTVSPSSTLSTTPMPTVRNKTIDRQLRPEDVDRLLRTSMAMKKRALLILKNLNLLEMELLNRWPDSNKYSCGASDVLHSTDHSEFTGSTETTTSKMHERLDKPTTPMPFLYNRSFYFGQQPQTSDESEADLDLHVDAALREQRKLEQKIREEYQMQHEMMRPENQRLLLQSQSLESKRKRARYEAAPAAAARLELMTTPASSNSVANKMRSSAAIDNLAHKIRVYAKRNHIDLTRQPLHSWRVMRKYMRKRKTKMLAPITPEGFSESANGRIYSATCVRPQMQRVQRQQRRHSRTRQRLP